jgi:hypothetical protein
MVSSEATNDLRGRRFQGGNTYGNEEKGSEEKGSREEKETLTKPAGLRPR